MPTFRKYSTQTDKDRERVAIIDALEQSFAEVPQHADEMTPDYKAQRDLLLAFVLQVARGPYAMHSIESCLMFTSDAATGAVETLHTLIQSPEMWRLRPQKGHRR